MALADQFLRLDMDKTEEYVSAKDSMQQSVRWDDQRQCFSVFFTVIRDLRTMLRRKDDVLLSKVGL